ncbi:putative membrane protein, partial [Chlamydia psittaci 84-8471/1]
ILYIVFNRNS